MNILHFRIRSGLTLLAAMTLTPGCALPLAPPAKSSGPAVSREGVQVAVVGQLCTQSTDYEDDIDSDHANVDVKVEIRNTTTDPVTIDKDRFRLVARDNSALDPLTFGRDRPFEVKGGETRSFELRFQPYGTNQCLHGMQLKANSGIVIRDKVVPLSAVSFVPWSA
jgi:hypothetical protein